MTAEMKLDGQRYDFVVDDDKIYVSDEDEVSVPLLLIRRNSDDAEVRRIMVRFCSPDSPEWHALMSEGGPVASRVGSECITSMLSAEYDVVWPHGDESNLVEIMPYTCECVGREVWNAAVGFDRAQREGNA